MNKKSIAISLIIYWICFYFLLPHFIHQVDPDGIAYVNQAKLYFTGGFFTAINGCWSSLFPILLSPFVKLGIDPLLLCRLLNGLFSCLLLFSVNELIKKFKINYSFYLTLLPFVICIIMLSITFYLLGPDVLQTLLLSILLNILLQHNFFERKLKIILAAFIATLCYLAKSYNFSIITVLAFILFGLHYYITTKKVFSFLFFKKLFFFYTIFLLFCSPYIIIISIKYNKPTFSTAGPITMHKSLAPEDFANNPIFIPPPSLYSLASSDDPSLNTPNTINFFTSKAYFLKTIKIFFATIIEYTKILNQISFLSSAIIVFFLLFVFIDVGKNYSEQKLRLITFMLLYPLGYFLIAIEWRYVWINIFTLLVMLSVLLNYLYEQKVFKRAILYFITIVSLLSFCVSPITNIRKNNIGDTAYQIAEGLKKNRIQGNFIYDPHYTFDYYYISYFSNLKCFGMYNINFTNEDIVKGKTQYGIKYVFYYYKNEEEKKQILLSPVGNISNKIYDTAINNLIVFELK